MTEEFGLTFLFISHDQSVVAHTCDKVAVMYLGKIVEVAETKKLFFNTRHPYTKALLSAIPSLDPDAKQPAIKLEGEIPSPTNPPSGCKFHTRCAFVQDICRSEEPHLEVKDGDRFVACHFADELMGKNG